MNDNNEPKIHAISITHELGHTANSEPYATRINAIIVALVVECAICGLSSTSTRCITIPRSQTSPMSRFTDNEGVRFRTTVPLARPLFKFSITEARVCLGFRIIVHSLPAPSEPQLCRSKELTAARRGKFQRKGREAFPKLLLLCPPG